MKRRLIFSFIGAVLAVNLLIGAKVYSNSADGAAKDSVYPNMKLFSEVMEKVRRDLLSRTAQEYRDSDFAKNRLVQGLNQLANTAQQLAKQDATELVQRFGELGKRKFNLAA